MVLNLDMEFRASSAGMSSSISASPFHEYPMDQSEFQYIEDSLGDNYFDVVMAENTRPVTASGEGGGGGRGGGGRGGGGGGGGGEVGLVGGEDLNSYFVSTPDAAVTRQTENYFVSNVGLNSGLQNGPHHHHQRLRSGGADVMMGALERTEDMTRLGSGLSVASEDSNTPGGDSSIGGGMVEDVMMGAMTMQYMLEEGGDTFQSMEDDEEGEEHVEGTALCDVRFSNEGVNKNKISPLQRKTLDAIFEITDKPSRGMINHIALTLTLADITVKNFFSNARRRRRRAEARLQDPERARRENERRKEKRRLAAEARLHSIAEEKNAPSLSISNNNNSNINNNNTSMNNNKKSLSSPSLSANGSPTDRGLHDDKSEVKETAVLSPERKVLMEKLADKVQRNALKNLTAELNNVAAEDHNQNLKNLMSVDYLSDFNQNLRSLEIPEDTGPLPGFHADPGSVLPFPDYADPSGCWQSLDAFIN